MAAAPRYKIFDRDGEYKAAAKELEAAAALAAFYGYGATIRIGHATKHIVFTNGADFDAAESYDLTSEIVQANIRRLSARGPIR